MTTMEIIHLYQIILENKVVGTGDNKSHHKSITIDNATFDRYLLDWKNVNDIDEDLLPQFEIFNEDPNAYFETAASREFADVTATITRFYVSGHHDFPDGFTFELPTDHFKIIIEIWRDFLLEPPLDGTKYSLNA